MSDAIGRESPLARFELAARAARGSNHAGVAIGERAFLGHLDLRGDVADSKFAAAVREAVGVAPPETANTVVEALGNVVYWLGPDEWLIVTSGERGMDVERGLRSVLKGVRSAITDVTGGQTVIVVRGARARDVLAKGCPLDLHPRAFDVGQCAQSHVAKAGILLRLVNTTPTFEIVVRRSFADYLWLWLEDAAREYGIEAIV